MISFQSLFEVKDRAVRAVLERRIEVGGGRRYTWVFIAAFCGGIVIEALQEKQVEG